MRATRVHVLTPGFTTPNGRAFLFPLVVWRHALAEAGIHVDILRSVESVGEADAILVDSKFHRDCWETDYDGILSDFAKLRSRCDNLIYCDTTDSSGWIQTEVLPLVDSYWKFQLLRDRVSYLKPMYGHRIYADYYHRTKGVTDAEPAWSRVVKEPRLLDKLRVSWNSGLADYSLYGPFYMAAYQRLPLPWLLGFPENAFTETASGRTNMVSCRFGSFYPRASVAWQRQTIRRVLGHLIPTNKLSRRQYLRELRSSRVVVSPFGYGEITLKDFEVFLTGGLLIKPDMSHLETWPNFFRADETMLIHTWNLDNLELVVDDAVSRWDDLRAIAEEGQACYRRHICSITGPALFVNHLRDLLN